MHRTANTLVNEKIVILREKKIFKDKNFKFITVEHVIQLNMLHNLLQTILWELFHTDNSDLKDP